jgi:hypothetical protein
VADDDVDTLYVKRLLVVDHKNICIVDLFLCSLFIHDELLCLLFKSFLAHISNCSVHFKVCVGIV